MWQYVTQLQTTADNQLQTAQWRYSNALLYIMLLGMYQIVNFAIHKEADSRFAIRPEPDCATFASLHCNLTKVLL